MEAMKKLTAPKARVIRDGNETIIVFTAVSGPKRKQDMDVALVAGRPFDG